MTIALGCAAVLSVVCVLQGPGDKINLGSSSSSSSKASLDSQSGSVFLRLSHHMVRIVKPPPTLRPLSKLSLFCDTRHPVVTRVCCDCGYAVTVFML